MKYNIKMKNNLLQYLVEFLGTFIFFSNNYYRKPLAIGLTLAAMAWFR